MILSRHKICSSAPRCVKTQVIRSLIPNPWSAEDYKNKLLYVHVPRTGGTSLCKVLYGKQKGHSALDHFYAWDYNAAFKHFKFAIVRNPWDRLVSAYHQLSDKPNGASLRTLQAWRGLCLNSFEQMVYAMEDPKLREIMWWRIPHLRSQSYYIDSSFVKMDYVGRFENLLESIEYISTRLKIPIALAKSNSTNRTQYQDYYTLETRQIVGRIYEEDISSYGYDFE